MQVKIKTCNGKLLSYLSADKVYDVVEVIDLDLVRIVSDDGDHIVLSLSGCAHLYGGSWEIVKC